MSVSNLFVPNNETIFCKKLVTDDLDLETLEIGNIIVDNATVLAQVTTPHINSGTSLFNTVDTINLNAINSTIQNLNVPGTLTAASFNPSSIITDNLTVNDTANIDTINVDTLNLADNLIVPGNITCNGLTSSTIVSAPTVSTNNITSPTGSISNLTSSSITASGAISGASISSLSGNVNTLTGNGLTYNAGNITSLSGNDINYSTGSISSLSGTDINYSTGIVSTLSGSEFSYDTGYAAGLSCKELRIATELVECPRATTELLAVNDTASIRIANIQEANIDVANISSLNVPGGLSVAGAISASSLSTSSITLGVSGGFPSTPLSFYYYDTANVAITGGAIGTTTFFRGIRIGNAVTLQIGLPGGLTAASNIAPINIAIPVPFRNPTACRGTCIMQKGATTVQGTWITGVTAIQIHAGLRLSDFWNIGELCSFTDGGTWSFDWVI